MSGLPKGVLFCMGNPLLDMICEVDADMLKRYSLKANDAILAEEKHVPLYKELQKAENVDYIAGGATQNTCRVFQWILNEPERCTFLGCIGKDEFGEILEQKAKEAGVNVQYQYDEKTPTGTCAVLTTDSGTHRSLCANLGAANCFTIEHLKKESNQKLLNEAKFFYISGFFLTVSPDSMILVGEHSTQAEKTFCVNLSAPFIAQFFKDQLMSVMPFVDILFGNESEAAELAKSMGWPSDESVKEIAKRCLDLPKKRGSRMVVFTQGTDPVIVAKESEVLEFPVEKISKDQIVDTNGAGDSFVGGFLVGYAKGKSIEDCVNLGVKAASMIIKQSGVTLPNRSTCCWLSSV